MSDTIAIQMALRAVMSWPNLDKAVIKGRSLSTTKIPEEARKVRP
ncbi:MAG: hypothetical protein ACPGWR_26715 [Ardenticatenaceae bacterium]